MAKRPKSRAENLAYFVRRGSDIDDTAFFSDEGRRVWFEKASWAAWILKAIPSRLKPRVVRGPIQSGDVPYQEFLRVQLPGTVTIRQYLDMIETWTRETMKDSPANLRRVTRFLRNQLGKRGQNALYSTTEEPR